MVLPQGISKATGLREVLDTLRLSLHNCIAIGDAENDYQLLERAKSGVAVGWGSKSLRAIADEVLPGEGRPAWQNTFVGSLNTRLAAQSRGPPARAIGTDG
jgi:3-deoxy-D-manno-octulosonate 8-phosphate phosphatase KdsC-like HAD superfamily phosphatase